MDAVGLGARIEANRLNHICRTLALASGSSGRIVCFSALVHQATLSLGGGLW